jgi:hypothetical protein
MRKSYYFVTLQATSCSEIDNVFNTVMIDFALLEYYSILNEIVFEPLFRMEFVTKRTAAICSSKYCEEICSSLCRFLQPGRQAFTKVLDLPPSFPAVRTEKFDWFLSLYFKSEVIEETLN